MANFFLCALAFFFSFYAVAGHDLSEKIDFIIDQETKPRMWNEVILELIRNDKPRPTVAARNLYHLSALMWDVSASFDATKKSVLMKVVLDSSLLKQEAMDYAIYTFLVKRYASKYSQNGQSFAHPFLNQIMNRLGYSGYNVLSASALAGVEFANQFIALTLKDGSRELQNYIPKTPLELINSPLYDVSQSGLRSPSFLNVHDLNSYFRDLSEGLKEDGSFYYYYPIEQLGKNIGSEFEISYWGRLYVPPESLDEKAIQQDPLTLFWGYVSTFSKLEDFKTKLDDVTYVDPIKFDLQNEFLTLENNRKEFIQQYLDVVKKSSLLNPVNTSANDFDRDGKRDFNFGAISVDISPAFSHRTNPVTKEIYSPNFVKVADYYRSLAEFWADGPRSETPPGHWNAIANDVVDAILENSHKFMWMGEEVISREEFELRLYLTLNGAVHDSAVSAWAIKSHYQGGRPVTVIRKLAAMAEQDFDFATELVGYDPLNLKMVTYERKTLLGSELVNKLAIKSWRGPAHGSFYNFDGVGLEMRDLHYRKKDQVSNEEDQFYRSYGDSRGVAGAGWILAENWMPYQKQSFVTPPFPGFISGHSTFSRAAAEVLAKVTGSEYFPNGLGEFKAPRLVFESSSDVKEFNFQWATYYDASDSSGESRIYGGIHAEYDDLPGRRIGAILGQRAVQTANELFQPLSNKD